MVYLVYLGSHLTPAHPLMKCPIPDARLLEITQGLYTSFMTPKFILRKLASLRSWDDIKFASRAALKVLGHLSDFNFLGIGTRQRNKAKHGCGGRGAAE
jgi:hypothetical protein